MKTNIPSVRLSTACAATAAPVSASCSASFGCGGVALGVTHPVRAEAGVAQDGAGLIQAGDQPAGSTVEQLQRLHRSLATPLPQPGRRVERVRGPFDQVADSSRRIAVGDFVVGRSCSARRESSSPHPCLARRGIRRGRPVRAETTRQTCMSMHQCMTCDFAGICLGSPRIGSRGGHVTVTARRAPRRTHGPAPPGRLPPAASAFPAPPGRRTPAGPPAPAGTAAPRGRGTRPDRGAEPDFQFLEITNAKFRACRAEMVAGAR